MPNVHAFILGVNIVYQVHETIIVLMHSRVLLIGQRSAPGAEITSLASSMKYRSAGESRDAGKEEMMLIANLDRCKSL